MSQLFCEPTGGKMQLSWGFHNDYKVGYYRVDPSGKGGQVLL